MTVSNEAYWELDSENAELLVQNARLKDKIAELEHKLSYTEEAWAESKKPVPKNNIRIHYFCQCGRPINLG